MKNKLIISCLLLLTAAGMCSCKKDIYNGANSLAELQFTDSTAVLKSLVSFPLGMAAEYPLSSTNNSYWSVVKREAGWITFGNELKNDAVVKSDGTYDFTRADNFLNLATTAGIKVFGHTLVWHSQQRASYYNSLIGGGGSGSGPTNLVVNPGFETTTVATTAEPADGWSVLNGAGQFVSTGTNVNGGAKALQVNVPAGGQNYNTQLITKAQIPVTAGKTYTISYYIKGATAQNVQFEIRPYSGTTAGSVNYQGGKPVTTSYAKVSYDYAVPVGVTAMQLAFDLGGTQNTLYLDDVSITDASIVAPPSGGALATIVDNAMKNHIQKVVSRYVGKITAWDVINEPFSDAAELRNNTNTPVPSGRTDIFVWQNYLGRDYAAKAFTYARASDPTADLYMNDYNLEASTAKLDAFVTLAKELKAANTGITGVGTQMHCNINTSYTQIDNMFQKLAATGLKVRVSELDIRLNPSNKTGNVGASIALQNLQAAMYNYVAKSYLKYVPEAQRGGITVWGVADSDSWITTSLAQNDAPLLFNATYGKKPAFSGFAKGLKGQ
ncbi:endo-1,4-beta-xylanase [Pedobacter sp. MC2016-14]|uniref:endo-1,4-beta-xylanase n=1 Tax=Pedobacter sp. MC2016-14 TaxID=2897327 RepID=UPI001E2F6BEB|nr:endo-1,4-beta-xylanase [Pedobacter sp. MC2016-14]MCD0487116.1 endo-1,4-beta-xylanase [Pedobacter sp. MC2016-14]